MAEPDVPAWLGPRPAPLSFDFATAAVHLDHLEELLGAVERLLRGQLDLVERALLNFDGQAARAFRERSAYLAGRWELERQRIAGAIADAEAQVAHARAAIAAREAERQAWEARLRRYQQALAP
jgi:hypothetical protein